MPINQIGIAGVVAAGVMAAAIKAKHVFLGPNYNFNPSIKELVRKLRSLPQSFDRSSKLATESR